MLRSHREGAGSSTGVLRLTIFSKYTEASAEQSAAPNHAATPTLGCIGRSAGSGVDRLKLALCSATAPPWWCSSAGPTSARTTPQLSRSSAASCMRLSRVPSSATEHAAVKRIFDWKVTCPADASRLAPPIICRIAPTV